MEIYTDSQYSIGVVTGAKNAKANIDLIMSIRKLVEIVPFKVNFNYIEAHTQKTSLHHVGNRIADQLAGEST
jgi:ribonuclease HI